MGRIFSHLDVSCRYGANRSSGTFSVLRVTERETICFFFEDFQLRVFQTVVDLHNKTEKRRHSALNM